jgi:hypothetical protein
VPATRLQQDSRLCLSWNATRLSHTLYQLDHTLYQLDHTLYQLNHLSESLSSEALENARDRMACIGDMMHVFVTGHVACVRDMMPSVACPVPIGLGFWV